MSNNTEAQFNTEGQSAFPVEDTETENSTDSPSGEETDTDQTQSDEGESNSDEDKKDDDVADEDNEDGKNLAAHPRWKERENDWKNRFNKQEQRHSEEIGKLRGEFNEKYGQKSNDNANSEVPSWFGGDEQQWNQFQEWNKELLKQNQEDIQKQLSEKSKSEQKAIDEATDYMNNQVAEIEKNSTLNPQGVKVDRNKLLKFVLDNELVDTKGRWNYKAGWQLMRANVKQVRNESLDDKKKLANATNSENRAETKPNKFSTSEDFENPGNRPW